MPEQAHLYGKTNLEKHIEEMITCREIVRTVLDFGVNQKQIVRIMKLLSHELVDRDHMVSISSALSEIEKGWDETVVDDESEEQIIVVPK